MVTSLAMLAVGCSASTPTPTPATAQSGSQSPSAGQPDTSGTADAACPETAPVPARSIPATVRGFGRDRKWYGADDLWVADPTVPFRTNEGGAEYRTKYASLTLDARGRSTDRKGAPRIGVERLDSSGAGHGDTGGFATVQGDRHWWPTVIDFPAAGCWEVTETLGSIQVRFTVRVGAGGGVGSHHHRARGEPSSTREVKRP